jgi:hypothetical protein
MVATSSRTQELQEVTVKVVHSTYGQAFCLMLIDKKLLLLPGCLALSTCTFRW